MRLFGWFRRSPQQAETFSERSSRRWTWLGGRRILTNTPYVMPKDKAEGDRLDLQHHLLKLASGKNYRAPLRQPHAILDVACGTGIWGREMAQEFKRAQIIGFDIDRTPMEASLARLGPTGQFPTNFQFLEADAIKRFPFDDEQFDFAHARFISPFLPVEHWPHVAEEMVRVTKRGGYIELVDFAMPNSTSPTFNYLMERIFKRLLAMRGLHEGGAPHVANYLRQAGLTRVQERHIVLGTGPQAARQQRLLVADSLAVWTNLQPVAVKLGLMSEAEYDTLLTKVREELPRTGYTWPVTSAFSIRL
ncbi:MAG TPA: methyltransferase domain-containing protein [Ktedonobacterales bacterium]|nr:methyltransferase domain-containing protein [Ktedonobacterales bacterium]